MFDIGSPYTAPELAQALQALEVAGSALSRQFTPAEYFAPQGSAWSPADHIRHLRKTTLPISWAFYIPGWIVAIPFGTATGSSRSYIQIRDAYRATLSRSANAGIFTPRPEASPADPAARREAILQAWHHANTRFATAIGRWPEPDLDRYRLTHPRLGRLTLREMAAFTVYHTAHHLARIVERAGKPGFEGS